MKFTKAALCLVIIPLAAKGQSDDPRTFSRPWQLSPWVGFGVGLAVADVQIDSGGSHAAGPFVGATSAGLYLGHGLSADAEFSATGIANHSTTVTTMHLTTFGDLAGWSAGLKVGIGRGWFNLDGDRLVDERVTTVAVLFCPRQMVSTRGGSRRPSYGTTSDMFIEQVQGRKGPGRPPGNAHYQLHEVRMGYALRVAWFDLKPPK